MIFPISYGHSVVYPSINDCLLPLWYLQTFLTNLCTVPCRINAAIVRDRPLVQYVLITVDVVSLIPPVGKCNRCDKVDVLKLHVITFLVPCCDVHYDFPV
jgi:hypothetical protein